MNSFMSVRALRFRSSRQMTRATPTSDMLIMGMAKYHSWVRNRVNALMSEIQARGRDGPHGRGGIPSHFLHGKIDHRKRQMRSAEGDAAQAQLLLRSGDVVDLPDALA